MPGLHEERQPSVISRRLQLQHVLAMAGGAALCATPMLPTSAKTGNGRAELLATFADAASDGQSSVARSSGGRYVLTEPVRVAAGRQPLMTLDLSNVELVFGGIAPGRNQAFLHIHAVMPGQSLVLKGLTVRLARRSIRTPGSDMIRLSGFANYELDGVRVLSADNMGLCIGRGDPFSFTPDAISIANCEFGGWRADLPHSHASIGDTAIWVITPARRTSIQRCHIRETGDDAIFVGHSASTKIEELRIQDNDIVSCSGGIGVAVPHARITANRIRRTNNAAIRCEVQNGNQASNCVIAGNTIIEAGQLSQGELGQHMIPKWHPHAIWVYQGGGGIHIEDNTIRRCRGSAIVLMPHRELGALSNVHIQGGLVQGVGVDDTGQPVAEGVKHAVIRRAAVAGLPVRGLIASDMVVEDLVHPLLVWINRECADDDPPVLQRMRLRRARLGDNPLVYWEGTSFARGSASVSYVGEDAQVARHLQASTRWLHLATRPEGGFVIVSD